MRAWRGPNGEPERGGGPFGRRSSALIRVPRARRGRRDTDSVPAPARAHCGRDPCAALPNHVYIRCLRLVGRLKSLSLVEVLNTASDDDECSDETAKHDRVQHGDCRRVREVVDAEYPAWRTRRSCEYARYDGGHGCQEDERYPE
jgi:hypothetical protein